MASGAVEDPATWIFWPRSKALQGSPLIVDDDEALKDNEEDTTTNPSEERPVERDRNDIWKEIAYAHNGRVETATLPEQGLRSLIGLLPVDAWDTLLSDRERQELAAYLPKLGTQDGQGEEEQHRETVRRLLSGETFHFANPVASLDVAIRQGRQTNAALAARQTQHNEDLARFSDKTQALLRRRWQEVMATREAHSGQHGESSSPAKCVKRTRPSSSPHFVQRKSTRWRSQQVSESSSLFLAIWSVLDPASETPSPSFTAEELFERIQKGFPGRIPTDIDLNERMDSLRYFDAALQFLCASASDQTSTKWIAFDPAARQYKWETVDMSEATVRTHLFSQERTFLQAYKNVILADRGASSSMVKSMYRDRHQYLKRAAIEQLRNDNPAFPELQMVADSHPSTILKQSNDVRVLDDQVGLDEFREQEKQRYLNASRPFAYMLNGCRTTVGPAFDSQIGVSVVRSTAPKAVNFASIVYDACARLPQGYGSRADIKKLIHHSQFLNTDACGHALDEAITLAVELLAFTSPAGHDRPCIHFDTMRHSWVYDAPVGGWVVEEDTQDIHASSSSKTPEAPAKMSIRDLLH